MAKFLIIANYSSEGVRGIKAEGGSARREVAEKACADLGGRLESFHFAFGKDDAYVIVDLPDNRAAAALGLTLGASGVVSAQTVVLLTPEEIDQAAAVDIAYRPPTA